ncbi:GntR family transcriptional regulator [Saccharopolyspora thermophila]|nr:GntR family transcriptional regulator [Saccharopolyspora subtropica]
MTRSERESTPATPTWPADRRSTEARNILAAANAFALLRSKSAAHEVSRTHAALCTFLETLNSNVAESLGVRLLVDSRPGTAVPEAIDAWVRRYPRFQQDYVPAISSWIDEVELLLAGNPLCDNEGMPGFTSSLSALRDDIRSWCDGWTPHASPFSWVGRTSSGCHGLARNRERDKDSRAGQLGSAGHDFAAETTDRNPGTPRITDRVVQLVREALAAGQFHHGQRVTEALLAERLGVSRGPVREALRVLTEEGMLERRRNRGAVVPRINTITILDLYAARAMLGTLLMRRAAMLRRSELRPV